VVDEILWPARMGRIYGQGDDPTTTTPFARLHDAYSASGGALAVYRGVLGHAIPTRADAAQGAPQGRRAGVPHAAGPTIEAVHFKTRHVLLHEEQGGAGC